MSGKKMETRMDKVIPLTYAMQTPILLTEMTMWNSTNTSLDGVERRHFSLPIVILIALM